MPCRMEDEDDIEVGEAPTSIDPYAVLGLANDATSDHIKSAYRKAALRYHPDKASPEDKDEAHTKFQEVAFAYAILSDERRRRRYDTTGRTEESLDLEDDDFNWHDFFKQQYEKMVTVEKIQEFETEYKGSEEERNHILTAYTKHEGNMDKLYQNVMLSDVLADDERFRGIIGAALANGEVEGYSKYTNESEKSKKSRITQARKRREKEAKEAETAAKEIKDSSNSKKKSGGGKNGDMGDLAALIQQRQKGRAENFFDNLEAKYAPKSKKGTKRSQDEPPEEAFVKNRKTEDDEKVAVGGASRSKRSKR